MSPPAAEEWGVDVDALTAWMTDNGLGSRPITRMERIPGGSQNILVRFERDGVEYVLRRPPINKRPNSDDTMMREARVLAALGSTDVPHARLMGACSDPSVIGAAFFLMEPVDGVGMAQLVETIGAAVPDAAHEAGLSVVDGAAAMARVDLVAVGLSDFGKADGWLERQVGRWRSQLEGYAQLDGYAGYTDIPEVDDVGRWLDERRPTVFVPGLIHGDYHFGNVMFARDRPVLAAIVDWELATIGDPLLDLAHLMATWPDGRDVEPLTNVVPGLAERSELVDRYAERSGRDMSDLPWFRVLACYRLGIILEGTKARADAGLVARETGDHLHDVARSLFRQAAYLAGISG